MKRPLNINQFWIENHKEPESHIDMHMRFSQRVTNPDVVSFTRNAKPFVRLPIPKINHRDDPKVCGAKKIHTLLIVTMYGANLHGIAICFLFYRSEWKFNETFVADLLPLPHAQTQTLAFGDIFALINSLPVICFQFPLIDPLLPNLWN